MIRAIAIILTIIAIGVIGAGCAFLFNAAYYSTGIEWQRPMMGGVIVFLALWEAVAISAAIFLWKHGYKPLAPLAILALFGFFAYTARFDILNQSQAQADRIASRTATIGNGKNDINQLETLRQQQAFWTAKLRSARPTELEDVQDHLDTLTSRVDALTRRMEGRPAVLEVAPDAALMSRLFGHGTESDWLGFFAIATILALPLGRVILTPIAIALCQIGWRRNVAPVTGHKSLLTPANAQDMRPYAAPVTEGATSKETLQVAEWPAVTEPVFPEKIKESEAAMEAKGPADPANDNAAVTEAPTETVEAAPVTAKKPRKKKTEEIDWSNVTALVPKIHLPKVDHVTAALDAVIDSGLAGHHLTPAIGRKRVNAILKHKHVKPISQGEYDRWSRERCDARGVTCESLVGRQLRFSQRAVTGKKGNTRLGGVSIPA